MALTFDRKHTAVKAQLLEDIQKADEARRKLKVIEEYERLMADPLDEQKPIFFTSEEAESLMEEFAPEDWSSYPASLAAGLALLELRKPSDIPVLFNVLKQHKNPIKNENVLRSILSRHSWFRKVRRGVFDLTEFGRKDLAEHIKDEKQKRAAST